MHNSAQTWSNWCILNLLLVCLSLHSSVSLTPPQPADNFLCVLSRQWEASKLVCEKCLVPESVFVVLLYHSNYNQFIHIIGSWRQHNTAWQPGFFSEMYCLAYSTQAKGASLAAGELQLCECQAGETQHDNSVFPLHPARKKTFGIKVKLHLAECLT